MRTRLSIQKPLSRRRLLQWGAGGCALGLWGAVPAATGGEARSLGFVHTHTGEELTVIYWRNGHYDQSALRRIDWLLRDFRTGGAHRMDPRLMDVLFDLHALCGVDAPFHIISAYRSPQTNGMLRSHSTGVAEHSLHMQGKAIDVRIPGVPTLQLAANARQLQRGGVGTYEASAFVHVDIGRVRYWQQTSPATE